MGAAALRCLVVGVSDGDTLTARCGEPGAYRQERVRISAIDAPEAGQAFGQRSKQSLSALCYRQQATINSRGRDRYSRLLADVQCQGEDAARHQVSNGMAWVYDRYARDHAWLYPHQDAAQATRRGLWADLDTRTPPVSPWEFRNSGGKK